MHSEKRVNVYGDWIISSSTVVNLIALIWYTCAKLVTKHDISIHTMRIGDLSVGTVTVQETEKRYVANALGKKKEMMPLNSRSAPLHQAQSEAAQGVWYPRSCGSAIPYS